ncbi:hypothetical protein [Ethanoligenens sp.]|uniref:hypothetical protein n=1 Tax=Ethanoligenens sp. TaxID=2099655 RepID=UPI0039ECFA12
MEDALDETADDVLCVLAGAFDVVDASVELDEEFDAELDVEESPDVPETKLDRSDALETSDGTDVALAIHVEDNAQAVAATNAKSRIG